MSLMSWDAAARYIRARRNMPTDLGSAELSATIPARVRAQSFFSAKVAEARILEGLRKISDAYSSGDLSLADARMRMRNFLTDNGFKPGGIGDAPDGVDPEEWARNKRITNLASMARMELILRQNAAQAAAVAQYEFERGGVIEAAQPNWRYVSRSDARPSHKAFNGKVFKKSDPIWDHIFPPRDFNCRCYVVSCTDEEAKHYGGVMPEGTPEPPVPESGYSFNPREAMTEFDLTSITDPTVRAQIQEDMEWEYGDQVYCIASKLKYTPDPAHLTYKDMGLSSAAEWPAAKAPPTITESAARQQLQQQKEVTDPEGSKVLLTEECLRHWLRDYATPKPAKDITGRLQRLPWVEEAIRNPDEIWYQKTQRTYMKKFVLSDGRIRYLAVAVTNNDEIRSWIIHKIHGLDKARHGLSHKSYIKKDRS